MTSYPDVDVLGVWSVEPGDRVGGCAGQYPECPCPYKTLNDLSLPSPPSLSLHCRSSICGFLSSHDSSLSGLAVDHTTCKLIMYLHLKHIRKISFFAGALYSRVCMPCWPCLQCFHHHQHILGKISGIDPPSENWWSWTPLFLQAIVSPLRYQSRLVSPGHAPLLVFYISPAVLLSLLLNIPR